MDHIWGAPSSVWKSLKTHILGAMSCYFRTNVVKDPVCICISIVKTSNFTKNDVNKYDSLQVVLEDN